MDAILFIGIVVIVIILLGIKSAIQNATDTSKRDILSLNKKLSEITSRLDAFNQAPVVISEAEKTNKPG